MKVTFIICPITKQLCLEDKCFFNKDFKSFTNGILVCVKVKGNKIYFRNKDGELKQVWQEENNEQ